MYNKFLLKWILNLEMYSFVTAECIQLNSFLVLHLNTISRELQFLWYQLQIWNTTWLDIWLWFYRKKYLVQYIWFNVNLKLPELFHTFIFWSALTSAIIYWEFFFFLNKTKLRSLFQSILQPGFNS